MKKAKIHWYEEAEQRLNVLNDLDVFHLKAYKISSLHKEKMKKYPDQKIKKHDFVVGDSVLLFNSRVRLFPGKLKSNWTGPFLITQVLPHGAVELENKEVAMFKVNGQRIEIYLVHSENANEVVEAYNLYEV
ncbi:uncharacterized protein [Solanum lycopersicum]|uniref:uncharacterized protein n=1 Tax=Solanum lycopersicum TaxID=4081 RepID=UPI0002BCAF64|nr:uncharacterized protein LOC101250643 [Solanum lycopersicum]